MRIRLLLGPERYDARGGLVATIRPVVDHDDPGSRDPPIGGPWVANPSRVPLKDGIGQVATRDAIPQGPLRGVIGERNSNRGVHGLSNTPLSGQRTGLSFSGDERSRLGELIIEAERLA
jgi:hypothetical protein